jgi:sterol 14-demethylase
MAAENSTFSPLVQFLPAPSQWNMNPPPLPAIVAGLAVVLMSAFFLRSTKGDKIHDVGGIPVLTAWGFFKRRFDFLQRHFKKTGGMMFRFRVLQASAKFLCHSRLLTTSNYSIEW